MLRVLIRNGLIQLSIKWILDSSAVTIVRVLVIGVIDRFGEGVITDYVEAMAESMIETDLQSMEGEMSVIISAGMRIDSAVLRKGTKRL